MSKIATIIFVAALLVGGYVLFTSNSSTPGPTNGNNASSTTKKVNAPVSDSNSAPVAEDVSSETVAASKYVDYSPEALTEAASSGTALIFFRADWCPTCRAAEKDIQANGSKLPNDLVILRADYDTETELKKTYEVVVQHTFVQVDATGNEITKWSGGGVNTINQNLEI